MKTRIIVISIVIILILTFSSLFLKIIPCKSWYGSNTGVADLMPHNTFCNIFYGVGPHNEYYYITSNGILAFLITLVIFSLVIFVLLFILNKVKFIK